MKNKFTTTKSMVESYKIRAIKGSIWADITIDSNGNKGRIQISSDYGSWQYYWDACGCPFKEFLATLDIGYVAGKFGANKWLDQEATVNSMRNRIDDYTSDKNIKEELRLELDELSHCSGAEEFCHVLGNSDNLMDMEDHCPDLYYSVSPWFRQFWIELWPVLLNEFKKENQQT